MSVAIITAVAENGVIGINNELPWHLPEDLKRFKELTTGKTVVMGRKTYESIVARLGKPLPNRKNVVITRQADYSVPEGVEMFNDLGKAIETNKGSDIFIIGGAEIFKLAVDLIDTMYITHIHKTYEGDSHFPKIDMKKWEKIDEDIREGFNFATYKKKTT